MSKLIQLNNRIIKCNKCPRLVAFRKKISKEKKTQLIKKNFIKLSMKK